MSLEFKQWEYLNFDKIIKLYKVYVELMKNMTKDSKEKEYEPNTYNDFNEFSIFLYDNSDSVNYLDDEYKELDISIQNVYFDYASKVYL